MRMAVNHNAHKVVNITRMRKTVIMKETMARDKLGIREVQGIITKRMVPIMLRKSGEFNICKILMLVR
jgi:hypothetical protein